MWHQDLLREWINVRQILAYERFVDHCDLGTLGNVPLVKSASATILKIAVLAPMPSANVRIAMMV
ncbi:MAG: hypothetical protein WA197_11925 [Candidatus Acidiferrales bacterium]